MAGKKSFSIYALLKGKDESAPLLKGLGKIRAGAKGISGVLSGLKGGLGSMLGPLGLGGVLGVASLGGAVAAVRHLTMGYAESQDELGAFARQHRMAVAEVQRWQFVAKMSEVSTDSLRGSMGGLTQTLGQVHAGAGRAFKFLSTQKNLSPLLKSLKGARSTSDALGISLNFLGRVKDQGQRALLAKKLGLDPEMLRIVDQGAAGIARLLKEADRYGTTSEKSARDVEEFNQAHKRLDASLEGLKLSIGEKLVPVLTPYITQLTDWVGANKDLIATKVEKWVTGAASAAEEWIPRMGKVLSDLSPILDVVGAGLKSMVWSLERLNDLGAAPLQLADMFGADIGGRRASSHETFQSESALRQKLLGTLSPEELAKAQKRAQREGARPGTAGYWTRVGNAATQARSDEKLPPDSSVLPMGAGGRFSGEMRIRVEAADGTSATVVSTDTSGPLRVFGDVGKPSHKTGGGL